MEKYSHKERTRALNRANKLYDAYWGAPTREDHAAIMKTLERLFRGEDPDFPGIKVVAGFDLKSIPSWDRRTPTRAKTFDAEDTALILKAIDGLNKRCDRLEKMPMFSGATPQGANVRALSLPDALAHAHAAHVAKQAEIWQERARRDLPPGTVPIHPNAAEEERQQTSDAAHHDPLPTSDANYQAYARAITKAKAAHGMIARTNHLTFPNR